MKNGDTPDWMPSIYFLLSIIDPFYYTLFSTGWFFNDWCNCPWTILFSHRYYSCMIVNYENLSIQATELCCYTPFQNLYQTDTDISICFENHIKPIPIIGISAIIQIPIPILSYNKPIPIPIQISEFISNRYRYQYDFILADTDTYYRYRYRYRLYWLSLL